MNTLKTLLAMAAVLPVYSQGFSTTLYDVNFSEPGQVVNQEVVTGTAPDYISQVNFGAPKVVSSFGGLTDQPLEFNSVNYGPPISGLYYYEQIQMNLPALTQPVLNLSFDFTSMGTQSQSMTVFFDTPEVRNFYLNSDGSITYFNPVTGSGTIGSFALGQDVQMDIQVNFALNEWSFYENGVFLDEGAFDAATVSDIRFNYSASGPNDTGMAIDNVLITSSTVPDSGNPPTLVMLSGALGLLWLRLRKAGRLAN